ncbi:MAG: outer membrane lipoprotein-sorting protein [Myxococcales bacterium]|nr:outer membrane lipoprotein-sorting protein [Myxococcales bacterium]
MRVCDSHRGPWLALAIGCLVPQVGFAAPTLDELLKKYDTVMGAESFESVARMTAHRDDGSERTYKMRILKAGTDKLRVAFAEPAAVAGQEMLRQGDNSWVYMPSLKRAIRLANRENFQGGDFNNADVLRVNYTADYAGAVAEDAARPDTWRLDLKAKSAGAAYDAIKLWVRRADQQPVRAEYYSASGKMLRMAEFSEVKDFGGGFLRPGKILMKNMLATARWTLLTTESFNVAARPGSSKFVLDDLGK